jgi:hypothetical protein
MRKVIVLVWSILVLAGCVPVAPDPLPSISAGATDASVLVGDAEVLIAETLRDYIDITNDIVGGADPSLIKRVTTAEWAIEELNGFRTLDALGSAAPSAEITQFEVMFVRGRHTLVDVSVAACIAGVDDPMRVSIYMVPRAATLVIAEIVPWKDSTWCAPLAVL